MTLVGQTFRNSLDSGSTDTTIFPLTSSDYHLIASEEEFVALCDEWQQLWKRVPTANCFQTFDYCFYSWKHIASSSKEKLICIVKRERRKAVFIWPLVKRYRGFVWSIEPLTPHAAPQYSDLLVEDEWSTLECVELAYEFLLDNCTADLIRFPYTRIDSHLYNAVSKFNAWNTDLAFWPIVKWEQKANWDDYYRSLSKSYRDVQKKKRRQLSAFGDVSFEVVDDKSVIRDLICWLLVEKRKWCAERNIKDEWVYSEKYKDFLIELSTSNDSEHPIVAFTLKLNGRILAVQLASVCANHVDWMIAAFDSEFARASPGMLLSEHCLQWAFSHKLECELGIGRQENKMFWSSGNAHKTVKIQIPISAKGLIVHQALKSRNKIISDADRCSKSRAPAHAR